MERHYGLFLDRESLGPRVLKNPTVALGVALIDMDNCCLAEFNGSACIKEVYIPPLPGQILDDDCVKTFWMRNESTKRQLQEWQQQPPANYLERTAIIREFVQYCETICEGRKVELFVDTPLFDVVGIDALLETTLPWPGKPPSWNFLLKDLKGKHTYTRVIDISSYLEGALCLHPENAKLAREAPGGVRSITRWLYRIPEPPPFPYTVDHHCSHDAARRGWEFAWIRAHLKHYSPLTPYGQHPVTIL
jgi:hypothetical protein